MKYLFVLLLCCPFNSPLYSRCANHGIYFTGSSTTLSQSGMIILEFYGSSQQLIPELNKKYPVYLKSSQGKTSLFVKQILKGQFRITQVLLMPDKPLDALLTYTFRIDKLPKEESVGSMYGKKATVFTVNSAAGKSKPVFEQEPSECKKTFASFGCGPARWVYFKVVLSDTACRLIKASVKSTISGEVTEYILPIENGVVKIGHGMCSGAFSFEEEHYAIVFSLLDPEGKESGKSGTIRFTAPIAATNQE